MNNKILIIAAHPDDEVLGCGAIIAKYSKTNEIYVLILGEGITSRYKNREEAKSGEILDLKNKSIEAGKILGVKETIFFDFPDQRFDSLPFLEIVKRVEEIIVEINPGIIYTHSPSDLNLDHRITFEAVLTATRPKPGLCVKKILAFEVISSTEWSFGKINKQFCPNIFEDISEYIELKIKAFNAYDSEKREYPHSRSKEAIISLANRRGASVGLKSAEALELIREIND